ncbi:agenet domain protein [Medicago truncatula]|uniref:Agenet domain protein n=1 Tax=Medicago truncatula TaxID=3880 RepID=G7JDF5_MEDTR|nr:agenet domain protein [Medicago truncatula]
MVGKFKFHPGNKVEVSIDHGIGIYCSWFTATIVKWVSSDKLLVEYDDVDVKPTTVGLHQLRPVPTPESDDWEVKIGDKVEAFRKQRWWEGRVIEDLGNGSFRVCFTDSEEIVFPKDLLRVHRQWINHNWVPPITPQQIKNHKEDRISDLPDCILLHTLGFLEARDAVRTCILSKRWKDLCKRVTTLTYTPSPLTSSYERSKKFMSWVLSSRDHSYSLLNLTIDAWIQEDEELCKLININPLLSLKINGYGRCPKSELLPLIFGSHSLTFLELCYYSWYDGYAKCPKSLHLPALRTLHLNFFRFVATHNHCADPFPNCHVLNILVLDSCSLIEDAQVLCISNQTLSNLTITYVSAVQFSLSTPNLSSFTIHGGSFFRQLLASTCNLSFLQQVNMYGISNNVEASIFLRWLQVLANVKILRFDYSVIETIQKEFRLNPISKKAQPPRFARLELFIVHKPFYPDREQEIMEVVKHLLQNTTSVPRVQVGSFCF